VPQFFMASCKLASSICHDKLPMNTSEVAPAAGEAGVAGAELFECTFIFIGSSSSSSAAAAGSGSFSFFSFFSFFA